MESILYADFVYYYVDSFFKLLRPITCYKVLVLFQTGGLNENVPYRLIYLHT